MSVHKSLKLKNTLVRTRNVLTRAERLLVLEEQGKWQKGQSIYGLPKTRTEFGKS